VSVTAEGPHCFPHFFSALAEGTSGLEARGSFTVELGHFLALLAFLRVGKG